MQLSVTATWLYYHYKGQLERSLTNDNEAWRNVDLIFMSVVSAQLFCHAPFAEE